MVTNDTDDKDSRIGPPELPVFRRIHQSRWLIVAFAALLVVLVASVIALQKR